MRRRRWLGWEGPPGEARGLRKVGKYLPRSQSHSQTREHRVSRVPSSPSHEQCSANAHPPQKRVDSCWPSRSCRHVLRKHISEVTTLCLMLLLNLAQLHLLRGLGLDPRRLLG
jgi:hypothetical protein